MITRLLVKLSQSIWFTSHFPISSVPSPMVVPCFSACQVRSQDLLRDRLGEKIFASRFSSLAYRPGEDWDKDSDLILIYSRYIYICMFIIVDIYMFMYMLFGFDGVGNHCCKLRYDSWMFLEQYVLKERPQQSGGSLR